MLDAFASAGFDVFAGSEVFLLPNMRNGGVGCISATANVNPAAIRQVFEKWSGHDADRMQSAITATRAIVQKYPVIPALKAIVARAFDDEGWAAVRPPLTELTTGQRESLAADLDANGFTMAATVPMGVSTS